MDTKISSASNARMKKTLFSRTTLCSLNPMSACKHWDQVLFTLSNHQWWVMIHWCHFIRFLQTGIDSLIIILKKCAQLPNVNWYKPNQTQLVNTFHWPLIKQSNWQSDQLQISLLLNQWLSRSVMITKLICNARMDTRRSPTRLILLRRVSVKLL